ncbi:PREDICTED: uncharacterized protein LOC108553538 [Eufriesea mexicana]|uniref:uncharacterized protein LOC108553538 n=1 Tax=Eufriesea mexicana TaxID=516756 RepID=UPI00083BB80E|nr:PREDICTED: uncharacterized protein LOC108553538 [Eufriesea mexicana]
MAELLHQAKTQRRTVRSQQTTFRKFLAEYHSRQNAFDQLKFRLERLDEMWKNFDKAQAVLEDLDPEGEGMSSKREEVEEVFFDLKAKAQALLNSENSNLTTPAISNLSEASGSRVSAKLPKLKLPEFNGSYEKWISFKDAFTSLIHNETSLDAVQKLQYLRSCLTGEAAEAIASFQTTAENYEEAWSLLTELYNNPRVIILRHLSILFSLAPMQRGSPESLRKLLNDTQQHLRSLKSLGQPTEHWDAIIVHLLTERLDKDTRREWEHSLTDTTMPTAKGMMTFLTRVSQAVGHNAVDNKYSHLNSKPRNFRTAQALVACQVSCHICGKSHPTQRCEKLIRLTPSARLTTVREAKLCTNCLRPNHTAYKCTSSKCRRCSKNHHTLLHLGAKPAPLDASNNDEPQDEQSIVRPSASTSAMATRISKVPSEVLLSTAQIYIFDKDGIRHKCRALLDSASQSHFITNRLADLLQLRKREIRTPVSGLNNISTSTNYAVTATLQSRDTRFIANINLLTIPRITDLLPSSQVNRDKIEIPANVPLADPEFHKPAEIDILIGAGLFFSLMSVGQIRPVVKDSRSRPTSLVLQKTRLGWIISGEMLQHDASSRPSRCHLSVKSEDDLDAQIQKFWQMEEIKDVPILTEEERQCERHFLHHTRRAESGKYIVKLPFKERSPVLGDSYGTALKRFRSLEFKLNRNPALKEQYSQILDEYIHSEYMSEITEAGPHEKGYFLPHHAVIKDCSTTTKLRIVFDGSTSTTTGVSLNEVLMAGPTIQEDLFSIVTRFRTHNYVLSADIERMFLQVMIHPEDRKYLRILWRREPEETIKTYQLNTLPFGLTCSPFLAVRSLQQLAEDEKDSHPRAAAILLRDFYIDDLQTGAETLEEACEIRDELIKLLRKGGFHLRQWCSNNKYILSALPENIINRRLYQDGGAVIKALGIHWNSVEDTIIYTVKNNPVPGKVTKRGVLSEIAKLFDPLGLIGPVIVTAKIIMQQLWQQKLQWDESLPAPLHTAWRNFYEQLHILNNLTIRRQITTRHRQGMELHGFCDASERAYGACLYLRTTDLDGRTTSQLICAKSRVAPLRTITIPRLELCAAVLLVNLYKTVKGILNLEFDKIVLWSDSTIVIHWIGSAAHTLKTFVANRVAEIQNSTSAKEWRHVASLDNPADALSRGQLPSHFMNNKVWFDGPAWLNKDESHWPKMNLKILPEIPEQRRQIVLNTINDSNELLRRYSSLIKLKRVIAYCLRFKNNCQGDRRITKTLQPSEIREATTCIHRMLQSQVFSREICSLQQRKELPPDSKLRSLNPFLDEAGVLRVGGRVKNANIPYAQRYPVLLPRSHPITDLVIGYEHLKNYHAGVQGTLYAVREN